MRRILIALILCASAESLNAGLTVSALFPELIHGGYISLYIASPPYKPFLAIVRVPGPGGNPPAPGGTITFIQSVVAHTAVPVTTLPTVITVTGGNTLIVGCLGSQNASFSCTVPTETLGGDTFTLLGTQPAGLRNSAIYYATGITGGTDTVSCNYDAATYGPCIVYEISITAPTSDGATGDQNIAPPYEAGSLTTTHAVDIVFSACTFGTLANNAITPDTGYTLPSGSFENNGSAFGSGAMEYQIVSSTGTFLGQFTAAQNTNFSCEQAALKGF